MSPVLGKKAGLWGLTFKASSPRRAKCSHQERPKGSYPDSKVTQSIERSRRRMWTWGRGRTWHLELPPWPCESCCGRRGVELTASWGCGSHPPVRGLSGTPAGLPPSPAAHGVAGGNPVRGLPSGTSVCPSFLRRSAASRKCAFPLGSVQWPIPSPTVCTYATRSPVPSRSRTLCGKMKPAPTRSDSAGSARPAAAVPSTASRHRANVADSAPVVSRSWARARIRRALEGRGYDTSSQHR